MTHTITPCPTCGTACREEHYYTQKFTGSGVIEKDATQFIPLASDRIRKLEVELGDVAAVAWDVIEMFQALPHPAEGTDREAYDSLALSIEELKMAADRARQRATEE